MIISVKKAKLNDYEGFLELLFEEYLFHQKKLAWMFKKTSPEKVFPRYYYEEILKNKNALFLLAKEGEDLVGFVLAFKDFSAQKDSLKKRNYVSIDELGVKATCKGKGIGTLLMDAVEMRSKNNSIHEIELNVREFNKKAIAFYQKRGYETISQKMRKILV